MAVRQQGRWARPRHAIPVWVAAGLVAAVVMSGGPAAASRPTGGGTDGATPVSVSPPPSACGQSATVTATFTNSGKTTWSPSTYALAAVPAGSTWGPSTIALPTAVAPGASVTFTWTATAPSSTGTYTWSWQMENGSTLFGSASPAVTVSLSCAIGDLFAGRSQLVDDPTFSVPATTFQNNGTPGHADTSTVDLGPGAPTGVARYRMFHRTFVGQWTSNGYGIPTGIALATSTDGNNWTPFQGGAPVLPDRPASGGPCTPDTTKCVIATYAPSVIVEGSTLTMAYEVMDTSVAGGGSQPRNWIEAATSTDYGQTWTSLTDSSGAVVKILTATLPWEGLSGGQNVGNVGTPDLHRDASGHYILGYHGYDGTHLARGRATGTSLLGLQRDAGNPEFVPASGWMTTGPGKASDTAEGAYTYRVFEAFSGSAGCVRSDNEVGWGLARSTDGVTWTYSSVNPIRTDRVGYSCGEDMPAWQIIGGVPHVLVTRLNDVPSGQSNVRRYAVSTAAPALTASSNLVAVVMATSGNGYWEVDAAGGVHAFGGAQAFSAVSGGGAAFVAAAARPGGDGLWLLTGAGQVVTSGGATSYGNATIRSSARAVAIESDANGTGYWIVVSNGTVQHFGDAPALALGSGPVHTTPVAITRVPGTSPGFWLVDRAGTIASYGSATVLPSPSGLAANAVGFGAAADGAGGWVVDARGEVFPVGSAASYGDTRSAQFSTGYQPFSHFAIVGMSRAVGSAGYYLVATDGAVIDFGTAPYLGHVRGPGSSS